MKMTTQGYLTRRVWLLFITLLSALPHLFVSPDGMTFPLPKEAFPGIEYRGRLLTYHRPPSSPEFPVDPRDPYNLFQKTAKGEILILPAPFHGFSPVAGAKVQSFRVKTHKGTPVLIYRTSIMLRRQFQADCHGLTFMNGAFWINSQDVDTILRDGKWRNIAEDDVREGDIAVYRNAKAQIVHSAEVMKRDETGRILVYTKSGSNPHEYNVWADHILVNDPNLF
jgi:hypothetical protein